MPLVGFRPTKARLTKARLTKDSGVILFPAIDLKGGACVRLVRGEMASATVFNDGVASVEECECVDNSWIFFIPVGRVVPMFDAPGLVSRVGGRDTAMWGNRASSEGTA